MNEIQTNYFWKEKEMNERKRKFSLNLMAGGGGVVAIQMAWCRCDNYKETVLGNEIYRAKIVKH